ncbi:papilin-like [Centruroides vittatus]|uniref:papilin-like n=1 Tax=Centruroides vittatus TaxID=120091 RepID=UPI00350F4C39
MKFLLILCTVALAYASKPSCRLEPETGLCRGYFPRFYYDPKDDTCKKFVYGGCGGNDNSYATEEECLADCRETEYSVDSVAYCHLKPEPGMCLAYMPRYYYNAKTRKCEKFIYGGCGGNANNFESQEACESKCVQPEVEFADVPVCEQPAKPGKCLAYMPRFYYDKTEGKCKEFIYGGCGGNENNFRTLEECEQQCGVQYYESTCQQKPETGPCRGYFPRYYYDGEKGECKKFVYGGCKGNDNNFQTVEDCETTCKTQESQPSGVCFQEKVVGPCRAAFPRFYYNQKSGRCESFIYGGCQGNENNFETLDECQDTCQVFSAEVDCSSAPETGPCLAYFRRYFYDRNSQTCKEFVYGGCQGNGNNYKTEKDCLEACACKTDNQAFYKDVSERLRKRVKQVRRDIAEDWVLHHDNAPAHTARAPHTTSSITNMKVLVILCTVALAYASKPSCRLEPETGMCRGYFPRFYYDPKDDTCKKFVYGGCGGNANSYATEEECLADCRETEYSVDSVAYCHLKPEPGMCLAYMPRYYYNAKTRKCEKFIYGGCGGNANNFESQEACESKCVQPEVEFADVPVCEQPVEPGKCLGFMPRFYYDKTEGRCRKFIYGGCGGNDNNFVFFEECEKQCGETQESQPRGVCFQEKVVGPCRAAFPRFYYNQKSGRCESFIYGGCQGNENNFETLDECQDTCQVVSAAVDCSSEPETGLCYASFRRYYYDDESETCKEFVYGGCGGNGNNYRTKEECLKTCASRLRILL